LPPRVPGHGRDSTDEAAAPALEVIGDDVQSRRASGKVGVENAPCLGEVRLCRGMVPEIAEAHHGPLDGIPLFGQPRLQAPLLRSDGPGFETMDAGLD